VNAIVSSLLIWVGSLRKNNFQGQEITGIRQPVTLLDVTEARVERYAFANRIPI